MALRRILMASRFSTAKVETYTVKQENTVIDYRTLTYTPTRKIIFDSSDRSLLYYYKPLPFTYMSQYALFLVPMYFLGRLIKYNPFYMTFPAALPIMFTIEIWMAIRFYKRFKYLRQVVSEVYLHKDGQTVEVHYQKQFWRKLKEENTKIVFYVSNLKMIQQGGERKPPKGQLFPQDWPLTQTHLRYLKWSYVKYYLNANNYFVFPMEPNYMNSEILVAVMNGKLINTAKQHCELVEGSMLEKVLGREIVSDDKFI